MSAWGYVCAVILSIKMHGTDIIWALEGFCLSNIVPGGSNAKPDVKGFK